jgi:hypothetical protein
LDRVDDAAFGLGIVEGVPRFAGAPDADGAAEACDAAA